MWDKWVANSTPITNLFQISSSIVTLLGIVGLYFVYLQWKATEEDVVFKSQAQIYDKMVEIDKIFIERPEARLYIYNNQSPEDVYPYADANQLRLERAKAEAAAEMMLDFFGQVMQVLPRLGPAEAAWAAYIQDIYKCSPVLRALYKERAQWYSDLKNEQSIVNIIERAEADLNQGKIACDQIKLPTQ
ncbi:MAG TPA: hypothetical protein VM553_05235 [Dongiaceae bacterium]|nr:hypothetical protein [Dongiaceae bacterium]